MAEFRDNLYSVGADGNSIARGISFSGMRFMLSEVMKPISSTHIKKRLGKNLTMSLRLWRLLHVFNLSPTCSIHYDRQGMLFPGK